MEKVNKIISLLEEGNHEEAMSIYHHLLEYGSDAEKLALADELFQYGFLEEAKELLQQLLTRYPDEGELLVQLAEINIELGDEDAALILLSEIEADDPSYPQSLLLQADLYQMDGLYEVSEEKLRKAKNILPDEAIIDFALGELYFEQGKFTDAIKAFETVLQSTEEVTGISIHQRLGDAYSAGGAFEQAIPFYEKALEERVEINLLFNYALTAYQAGLNQTAIKTFTEIMEIDPHYHTLYLYLAKAFEKEEQIDRSLEIIKEGIHQDEFNKDLYLYGGKLALKLGDTQEAERLLREAIALDPEYIEAGLTLNKLLIHLEKYESVLELADELHASGVEEPMLLWDEAIALAKLEKYSQSLNKYERAYNGLNNDSQFLLDYGYFLIEEGKRENAAEIFKRLLHQDPSNEEYEQVLQRLIE